MQPGRKLTHAARLTQLRIGLLVLRDDLGAAIEELRTGISYGFSRIATINGRTVDTDPRYLRAMQNERFVDLIEQIRDNNAEALERLNSGETRLLGQQGEGS